MRVGGCGAEMLYLYLELCTTAAVCLNEFWSVEVKWEMLSPLGSQGAWGPSVENTAVFNLIWEALLKLIL